MKAARKNSRAITVAENNFDLNKVAVTGNDVVMTGWAGLAGMAVMAKEMEWVLNKRFSPTFIKKVHSLFGNTDAAEDKKTAHKAGATAVYEIKEGGIFGALWDAAEELGTGLDIDLYSIPIRQETIEVSELFEINPYKLLSTGALLILTDRGHDLVREYESTGRNAAVIGKVTDGNDRVVFYDEKKRFLEPPEGNELDKIHDGAIPAKYR